LRESKLPPARDLTGLTFNDLTAICRTDEVAESGAVLWKFRCICGNEIIHRGTGVSKGEKISCGCHKQRKKITPRICRVCHGMTLRKNQAGYVSNICHKCHAKQMASFLAKNPKNRMVNSARERAQMLGLPFNITVEDIDVPTICPVLGIQMMVGRYADRDSSPSLDRIIPELGYVRGNVAVISFRANRIKSDGDITELEKVLSWMKKMSSIKEENSQQMELPLLPTVIQHRGRKANPIRGVDQIEQAA